MMQQLNIQTNTTTVCSMTVSEEDKAHIEPDRPDCTEWLNGLISVYNLNGQIRNQECISK